jgi:hypothetical protein
MPGAPRPRGPSIAKSPDFLRAVETDFRDQVEAEITEEERMRMEEFMRRRMAERQRRTAWDWMWISWMHEVESERDGGAR